MLFASKKVFSGFFEFATVFLRLLFQVFLRLWCQFLKLWSGT